MAYCNKGEPASVNWKFGNGVQDQFQATDTPISVAVTQQSNNPGQGYCSAYAIDASVIGVGGYEIPDSRTTQYLFGPLSSYRMVDSDSGQYSYQVFCRGRLDSYENGVVSGNCIAPFWFPLTNGQAGGQYPFTGKIYSINYIGGAPEPSDTKTTCTLTITDANNAQLYSTSGPCPCNFSVACGQQCPDGYCKIDCSAYPGYCCISEAFLDGLLQQLAGQHG